VDYRSMYASVLRDWWELPQTTADAVLGAKYQTLSLLG
jgi:hypothetical protein